MKRFNGNFLVKVYPAIPNIKYKVINDLRDFERSYRCIVVRNLNPDYYLLFNSINLIVTERGSALSHLAIIGMEYNLPIILAKNIISKIPKEGMLSVKDSIIEVTTNEEDKQN